VPGRSRWVVVAAVLALSGIAPASADATLVFVRGVLNPVVWAAADDGSGKHRVGRGRSPKVSPDGKTVAYLRPVSSRSFRSDLLVEPVAGGPARKLLSGCADASIYDWSPDSASLVVVCGPELGPDQLLLIEVASGASRTLARGFLPGPPSLPHRSRIASRTTTARWRRSGARPMTSSSSRSSAARNGVMGPSTSSS
jgi:hypothetical protein